MSGFSRTNVGPPKGGHYALLRALRSHFASGSGRSWKPDDLARGALARFHVERRSRYSPCSPVLIGTFRAEPERVELIDPRVVARLDAAGIGDALSAAAAARGRASSLRDNADRWRRAVERAFALAPVEARQCAARQRRPARRCGRCPCRAARIPTGAFGLSNGSSIDLGQARLGGFDPGFSRMTAPGYPARAPHRAVRRRRHA